MTISRRSLAVIVAVGESEDGIFKYSGEGQDAIKNRKVF